MAEVLQFKIYKAVAERSDNGNLVKLWYPKDKEITYTPFPPRIEFGIESYERLMTDGRTEIANNENPINPPSGVELYFFNDDKFVCGNRGLGARTQKKTHTAYGGYPQSLDEVLSAEGIRSIAYREYAEEIVMLIRDAPSYMVIPNMTDENRLKERVEYSLRCARERLGLELKPHIVDVEFKEPVDTLEVYNENDEILFKTKVNLDWIFHPVTSLEAFYSGRFTNLSSEEIIPFDTEGDFANGKFNRLNLESWVVDLEDIKGKPFGCILKNPRVYQTQFEGSTPQAAIVNFSEPYIGPEGIAVVSPYVFYPNQLLVRLLGAHGVQGFENWVKIQHQKDKAQMDGKFLIDEALVRKG
ncbi:hypothetical protein HYS31_02690 [Candidatus Woesearchaeota archaeon]|nr:hypothetical protein [Candidatus Woesearchaeota archaeon]